jgi:hypothetical protein
MMASDTGKASIAEQTDSTTPPMLQPKLKTMYPPLNNSRNAAPRVRMAPLAGRQNTHM